MKHVEINLHFIRERVAIGDVRVMHVLHVIRVSPSVPALTI
jgi:hypothetical protein